LNKSNLPLRKIGHHIVDVDTWNPARSARGQRIRYIDLGSIDNEKKCIASHQDIVAEEAPSRARQLVHEGDVLVSTVRPNLNGVARVPSTFHGATASTGFCVLRADNRGLDSSYLFHWVKCVIFVAEMMKKATGQSYPAVSDRIIKDSEIPLPPLHEQRRIAAILDQADALRRKQRDALVLLGNMGRAAFIKLFGVPSSGETAWPIQKLGEVGDLGRGISKHRPRNDSTLLGGPYPLIQTGDVANADDYIREYTSTYSEAGLRQSRIWPRGTLCITIAANIGKTAVLDFEACFPDSIVGFLPSETVTTEYIQYWMGFIQKKLEDEAPQSAQKNINLAILRDLNVAVPPLEIQNSFKQFICELDTIKAAARQHLVHLDSLFYSLQHRAFRGEL
jgi:type I restriction enzyme, S subunit